MFNMSMLIGLSLVRENVPIKFKQGEGIEAAFVCYFVPEFENEEILHHLSFNTSTKELKKAAMDLAMKYEKTSMVQNLLMRFPIFST